MAILKNGLLGQSRKSVGNIVTYVNGGQQIARTKPTSYNDAKTDAQLRQRSGFAQLIEFFRKSKKVVDIGFPERAQKHSPYNAFMHENLPNVITGTYPNVSLDLSKMKISKGSLLGVKNASAESTQTAKITVNWENNADDTTGFDNDGANMLFVNMNKSELVSVIAKEAGLTRANGTHTQDVPTDWIGDTVHVYLFFTSPDLRKASDSAYLGTVTVSS